MDISHEPPWHPQDRMAKRLGMDQKAIHCHLGKMAALPNFLNSDLSRGFTVETIAEKHGWTDPPMVWSLALDTDKNLDLSFLTESDNGV